MAARWRGRVARAAAVGALTCLVAGCAGDGTEAVSVFDAEPGDCLLVPEEVTAEVSELRRVGCEQPHHQEVYAVLEVTDEGGYPGDAQLKDFADGACAGAFGEYVGVDYRDSSLFFTYLLPSARSWEQGNDRAVTCLVTTTGEPMVHSVQGSGA